MCVICASIFLSILHCMIQTPTAVNLLHSGAEKKKILENKEVMSALILQISLYHKIDS